MDTNWRESILKSFPFLSRKVDFSSRIPILLPSMLPWIQLGQSVSSRRKENTLRKNLKQKKTQLRIEFDVTSSLVTIVSLAARLIHCTLSAIEYYETHKPPTVVNSTIGKWIIVHKAIMSCKVNGYVSKVDSAGLKAFEPGPCISYQNGQADLSPPWADMQSCRKCCTRFLYVISSVNTDW